MSTSDERTALADVAVDGRLTIYRGVASDYEDEVGLSWTLDREVAVWFADLNRPGFVGGS